MGHWGRADGLYCRAAARATGPPGSRRGLPGSMSHPAGRGTYQRPFLAALWGYGPEIGQGL